MRPRTWAWRSTEAEQLQVGIVEGAAHWLAEEDPHGFVEQYLAFTRGCQ